MCVCQVVGDFWGLEGRKRMLTRVEIQLVRVVGSRG